MITSMLIAGAPFRSVLRQVDYRAIDDARMMMSRVIKPAYSYRQFLPFADGIPGFHQLVDSHLRHMFDIAFEHVREKGRWLSSLLDQPVQVHGLEQFLESFRDRAAAALEEAYVRLCALLIRRNRRGGAPPGSRITRQPHRTRGPDPRRSNLVFIHRPAVTVRS
ncbi:hypothetical protein M1C57_14855 [Rhodococcus pyridinivorans]|uniref:Uncharacterized protein n=1 Tax=Rhodococcus pyridinivorans TaxID=103816 RepID=A0A7M2XUA4_9NOCA|nr:hypothetical protein [Rhodococcus pyridinivorans]QOW01445.1 hypothetical protein INP59_24895 [Rhodococcus pyridinivorans]UPW02966.1 hypothetical protein M1C57_14855 [Rhodococcus pyridinivorans]